jgi:hypothetical protein
MDGIPRCSSRALAQSCCALRSQMAWACGRVGTIRKSIRRRTRALPTLHERTRMERFKCLNQARSNVAHSDAAGIRPSDRYKQYHTSRIDPANTQVLVSASAKTAPPVLRKPALLAMKIRAWYIDSLRIFVNEGFRAPRGNNSDHRES